MDRYQKSFGLMDGARKTDDQSDEQSMRFWQGTSTMNESGTPAVLMSLHAIRFQSRVMVNLVYISTHDSVEEVQSLDRVFGSLKFTAAKE